jgi:hypothetical protein
MMVDGTCAVCGRLLPKLAIQDADPYCSRRCAGAAHGIRDRYDVSRTEVDEWTRVVLGEEVSYVDS